MEDKKSFLKYYNECKFKLSNSIEAKEYLKKRGISLATANSKALGYDENIKKIIIPTSEFAYVTRSITTDDSGQKYRKIGSSEIFNKKILKTKDNIFVVEGEFDALSIIELGYSAVALGSTANIDKFIQEIEQLEDTEDLKLIIALDNDDAGQEAQKKLLKALDEKEIEYYVSNIASECKDANELLVKNKEKLENNLLTAIEEIYEGTTNVTDYLLNIFEYKVNLNKKMPKKKTGFKKLDEKSRGLHSGLYVIGAISSLGKTTLMHQIAEQLVYDSNHVMYYSLEQSIEELVSKGIARNYALKNPNTHLSSIDIREGTTGEETEKVKEIRIEYARKLGDRSHIIEGNMGTSIDKVKKDVEKYIHETGIVPVVLIDYLQILKGGDISRISTKEEIDLKLTELKRLSRDHNAVVMIISSFNRSSYDEFVSFSSFKESGLIEYTADVLVGLQLSVLNDEEYWKEKNDFKKRKMIDKALDTEVRKIDFICLKNRWGRRYKQEFEYIPAIDFFREA